MKSLSVGETGKHLSTILAYQGWCWFYLAEKKQGKKEKKKRKKWEREKKIEKKKRVS